MSLLQIHPFFPFPYIRLQLHASFNSFLIVVMHSEARSLLSANSSKLEEGRKKRERLCLDGHSWNVSSLVCVRGLSPLFPLSLVFWLSLLSNLPVARMCKPKSSPGQLDWIRLNPDLNKPRIGHCLRGIEKLEGRWRRKWWVLLLSRNGVIFFLPLSVQFLSQILNTSGIVVAVSWSFMATFDFLTVVVVRLRFPHEFDLRSSSSSVRKLRSFLRALKARFSLLIALNMAMNKTMMQGGKTPPNFFFKFV